MKNSQLGLAVAALMVTVFSIAYLIILGSDAAPQTNEGMPPPVKPAGQNPAALTFETSTFPAGPHSAKEWEAKHPGHADFWFLNPHQKEVRAALRSKSCKCTDVEMFLAAPEWIAWKERKRRVAAATAMAGAATTIHLLREEAALAGRESQLTRYRLIDKDGEGFPVPAGASGWIRLSWTAEKPGGSEADNGLSLKVQLWMDDKKSGPVQALAVRLVLFPILRWLDVAETASKLDPARSPGQLFLGKMVPRELPRELPLIFGSPTRAGVDFSAEAVQHYKGEADTFVVGKPVPLSPAETEKVVAEIEDGPLMSAYRVPITLLPKAGDRYFDTGTFRRLIKITVNNGEMEPFYLTVLGSLQGDVEIGTAEDHGRLSFGPFPRAVEQQRHLQLATDVSDLDLQLDESRIPEHLKATLAKNKQAAGTTRRTWKLTVTIPADAANGPFPHDDHPAYRDSAVYVKGIGAGGRLIRIPVEGNALNQ